MGTDVLVLSPDLKNGILNAQHSGKPCIWNFHSPYGVNSECLYYIKNVHVLAPTFHIGFILPPHRSLGVILRVLSVFYLCFVPHHCSCIPDYALCGYGGERCSFEGKLAIASH